MVAIPMMSELTAALRAVRNSPAVSTVAILTMAVAIAAGKRERSGSPLEQMIEERDPFALSPPGRQPPGPCGIITAGQNSRLA